MTWYDDTRAKIESWGVAQGSPYMTLAEARELAISEGRPWPPPYPPDLVQADRIELLGDDRPDPLAEPEGYGRRPGQEPDQDSETCVHGSCEKQSRWRLLLGDLGEHVARLNLCTECALAHLSPAMRLTCQKCKADMQIGRIEPMRGQPADELEQIRAGRVQSVLDSLRGPFGR